MENIKIIYIAGYTRSGTTILSRMLGEIDGVLNLGEIYPIWLEGWIENRFCECGKPFSDCDYWQRIITRAFGSNSISIPQNILRLQKTVDRMRYLPQLFFPYLRSNDFNNALQDYKKLLESFYRAVAEETGKKFIIVPDKHIASACIISEIFETTIIHMVRDSRAVAFSWLKKKKDPGSAGYMAVIPPYQTALEWNVLNFTGEFLKNKVNKYMLLRYSDLATSPSIYVRNVAEFSGAKYQNIFSNGIMVTASPGHTASGNPDRFSYGDIEIKPDDSWISKLSKVDNIIVTFLTWPGLLRYRYL